MVLLSKALRSSITSDHDLINYEHYIFLTVYMMQQVTAAGKAVLITGCDSRVGYALAKQLDDLVVYM